MFYIVRIRIRFPPKSQYILRVDVGIAPYERIFQHNEGSTKSPRQLPFLQLNLIISAKNSGFVLLRHPQLSPEAESIINFCQSAARNGAFLCSHRKMRVLFVKLSKKINDKNGKYTHNR